MLEKCESIKAFVECLPKKRLSSFRRRSSCYGNKMYTASILSAKPHPQFPQVNVIAIP